jgi:DNA-directed RNA polymerase subunit delta
MWGLVEWNPPETKRSSVSSSSSSTSKMKAMSNRRRTSLLEGIQDDTDKA